MKYSCMMYVYVYSICYFVQGSYSSYSIQWTLLIDTPINRRYCTPGAAAASTAGFQFIKPVSSVAVHVARGCTAPRAARPAPHGTPQSPHGPPKQEAASTCWHPTCPRAPAARPKQTTDAESRACGKDFLD